MFRQSAMILGGLALAAGIALTPHAAEARVHVGFGVGFGVPYYGYGGWGGYGYPYSPYYYAPPVVYAPPPVVYAPPPPPVSYTSQPVQSYYYCDSPQGYYPSVQSCATQWRQVAAPRPSNR